jgi:tetratricopeptide (TPR) repeat protein
MDQEIHDFVLQLNREAMNYLKDGEFQFAIKTLKDAEKVLLRLPKLKTSKLFGITFNNFGCFYKRMNKPNVALKYLIKACKNESVEPVDKVNLAGTLLNICAIYSQLGKHLKALEQSCEALELLKEGNQDSKHYMSTLIIAYHNTGVEYEYLSNLRQAADCYKTAWTLALAHFGETHSLTQSVHQNYLEALEKLEKSEIKNILRDQQRTLSKFHQVDQHLPSINKKRSPIKPQTDAQKTRHRSPLKEESLKNDPDLNKVRFLTGERLQPMHKTRGVRIHFRTGIKESGLNEKIRENDDAEFFIDSQARTSSAPLNMKGKKYMKLGIETENYDFVQIKNFNEKNKKDLKFESKLKDLHQQNSLDLMKEENIEKFEALDEFIRGEEFILPEESPIVEMIKKDKEGEEKKVKFQESDNEEIKDLKKQNCENEKTTPELQENLKSLTLTQQVFQGYLKRKETLKLLTSVVLIQKHIRKYQCRSIYLNIRNAVIFIQKSYRAYLKTKS